MYSEHQYYIIVVQSTYVLQPRVEVFCGRKSIRWIEINMPQFLFFSMKSTNKVMALISGKFLNEQRVLRMPRQYYYPYYFLNVCSANVATLKGK